MATENLFSRFFKRTPSAEEAPPPPRVRKTAKPTAVEAALKGLDDINNSINEINTPTPEENVAEFRALADKAALESAIKGLDDIDKSIVDTDMQTPEENVAELVKLKNLAFLAEQAELELAKKAVYKDLRADTFREQLEEEIFKGLASENLNFLVETKILFQRSAQNKPISAREVEYIYNNFLKAGSREQINVSSKMLDKITALFNKSGLLNDQSTAGAALTLKAFEPAYNVIKGLLLTNNRSLLVNYKPELEKKQKSFEEEAKLEAALKGLDDIDNSIDEIDSAPTPEEVAAEFKGLRVKAAEQEKEQEKERLAPLKKAESTAQTQFMGAALSQNLETVRPAYEKYVKAAMEVAYRTKGSEREIEKDIGRTPEFVVNINGAEVFNKNTSGSNLTGATLFPIFKKSLTDQNLAPEVIDKIMALAFQGGVPLPDGMFAALAQNNSLMETKPHSYGININGDQISVTYQSKFTINNKEQRNNLCSFDKATTVSFNSNNLEQSPEISTEISNVNLVTKNRDFEFLNSLFGLDAVIQKENLARLKKLEAVATKNPNFKKDIIELRAELANSSATQDRENIYQLRKGLGIFEATENLGSERETLQGKNKELQELIEKTPISYLINLLEATDAKIKADHELQMKKSTAAAFKPIAKEAALKIKRRELFGDKIEEGKFEEARNYSRGSASKRVASEALQRSLTGLKIKQEQQTKQEKLTPQNEINSDNPTKKQGFVNVFSRLFKSAAEIFFGKPKPQKPNPQPEQRGANNQISEVPPPPIDVDQEVEDKLFDGKAAEETILQRDLKLRNLFADEEEELGEEDLVNADDITEDMQREWEQDDKDGIGEVIDADEVFAERAVAKQVTKPNQENDAATIKAAHNAKEIDSTFISNDSSDTRGSLEGRTSVHKKPVRERLEPSSNLVAGILAAGPRGGSIAETILAARNKGNDIGATR